MPAKEDSQPDPASAAPHPSTRERQRRLGSTILLAASGVLLLLIGLYFGPGLLLASQAKQSYMARDCASVLEAAGKLEKLYVPELAPFVRPALQQAKECGDYLKAANAAEGTGWSTTYQAYQAYLQKYPQGRFVNEAHQGMAQALLGGAKEQLQTGDYQRAVDSLLTVLQTYGDTPAKMDAQQLLPEVYFEWGAGLQAEKNYPAAAEKYQKAIETDADPGSASGPGALAQTALPKLHREWGETLLHEGKFGPAIQEFKAAVALAKPEDIPAMQDAVSTGYLGWAVSIRDTEGFLAALEKAEEAASSATSAQARTEAGTVHAELLTAFSQSTGSEAQQVMDEAVKGVCVDGNTARSPIIAIDPGSIRAYPFLTDLVASYNAGKIVLGRQVAAQTPASFHYAVCVQAQSNKIQSCPYMFGYSIERWRYIWNVELRDVRTGQVYKQTEITGGVPPACPWSYRFTRGQLTEKFYGAAPPQSTLDAWLANTLRNAPAAVPITAAAYRGGEASVLEAVKLRYDNTSGKMVVFHEVSFHDADGDASMIYYELVKATSTGASPINEQINISAGQQKQGAVITGQWVCQGPYEVTIRVRIVDQAGHVSEATMYTMYCR